MSAIQIESQIKILRNLLSTEPAKLANGKWNSRHFSLKGKIERLEKILSKVKAGEWLAQ